MVEEHVTSTTLHVPAVQLWNFFSHKQYRGSTACNTRWSACWDTGKQQTFTEKTAALMSYWLLFRLIRSLTQQPFLVNRGHACLFLLISMMSKAWIHLDNQKNCTLTHWYIHSIISTQVTHLSLSFWPRYCFWDTCNFLCRPANFLDILSPTSALWYYELLSMIWKAVWCTFCWGALCSSWSS